MRFARLKWKTLTSSTETFKRGAHVMMGACEGLFVLRKLSSLGSFPSTPPSPTIGRYPVPRIPMSVSTCAKWTPPKIAMPRWRFHLGANDGISTSSSNLPEQMKEGTHFQPVKSASNSEGRSCCHPMTHATLRDRLGSLVWGKSTWHTANDQEGASSFLPLSQWTEAVAEIASHTFSQSPQIRTKFPTMDCPK